MKYFSNISNINNQQKKVITLLTERPQNTYDLRKKGIYAPSARICELRAKGYIIVTTWQHIVDEANIIVTTWQHIVDEANINHRVALYTLFHSPINEIFKKTA